MAEVASPQPPAVVSSSGPSSEVEQDNEQLIDLPAPLLPEPPRRSADVTSSPKPAVAEVTNSLESTNGIVAQDPVLPPPLVAELPKPMTPAPAPTPAPATAPAVTPQPRRSEPSANSVKKPEARTAGEKPATPAPSQTKSSAKAPPQSATPATKAPTPSKRTTPTPKLNQPLSQPRVATKQTNGSATTPTKPTTPSGPAKKIMSPVSPAKGPTPSPAPSTARSVASARRASAPPPIAGSIANPGDAAVAETKKVAMNKVKVGNAPSPNIKEVKSKVGSLGAITHKGGGGKVQIVHNKLNWNAQSKVGSMSNLKYQPGGGNVKIDSQKVEVKAASKIGSLQNVKHKAGGGEKKIFDDKLYLKKSNPSSKTPSEHGGESSIPQSPTPQGQVVIGDV